MGVIEAKERLIDYLSNHLEKFKKCRGDEYQMRCPFCGDSSNENYAGHLYIQIDPTTESASPYICFKCQKKGVVGKELFQAFGFDDMPYDIMKGMKESKRVINDRGYLTFDYKLPVRYRYPNKIQYLSDRYEYDFKLLDLRKFKVITSIYDFLNENKIKERMLPEVYMNLIERDYIGFLTTGATHIVFRDVTGRNEFLWIDYPITNSSRQSRKFYTVIDDLNLETLESTDVYICEGVTDTIGAELFVNEEHRQSVICGSLGKNHVRTLDRLVQLGVFGSNVNVHLILDNDEKFNEGKPNMDTRFMRRYDNVFGSVDVYLNMSAKDTGVPKRKIKFKKYRI